MKKFYLVFICFFLNLTHILKAQPHQPDSILYYLRQVKGLQSSDSALLLKAVSVINNTSVDSLQPDKIDAELRKLLPVIEQQNYLAMKTVLCEHLSLGNDKNKAIDYGKNLITELTNYSNQFEKNLLISTLAETRFPFRNSNRINEGVDYYQRLANNFELANDSDAASICYYVLTGLYRPLGLIDKVIYCQKKSITFLNRNKIEIGNQFPQSQAPRTGLLGFINRKAVLGGMLIDYEEPGQAFPFLYEAKNIYEAIKDSVLVSDGPYIYLQLTRAKILTNGDSVNYYFEMMRKNFDSNTELIYLANYCQARSYYFYLQNQLDSAEYFIHQSAAVKESNNIMINSFAGYLLPGYYLSLIKIKQHKYTNAIQLLKKESNELLKVNLRRMVLKEWLLLSTIYKITGDFENATVTLDQYTILQKQIGDDENKSRSVSFETEQQINLLNTQKQKQEQEIGRQKLIRNWITGGLAVVFMFSIIILFQRNRIAKEKKRSEDLLLNILPSEVADELKAKGTADAKQFDAVTVMFTDFKGFTQISERLSPSELVAEIHNCFKAFDNIISKHNIEKIKTIGDSYMCAGGLPVTNKTNATDVVGAAIEIQQFMQQHLKQRKNEKKELFEIRIGIHTGAVVAGIVGVKKFAYDIWGDTVNIASRMESSGEAGKVNISGATYQLVKDKFTCIHRGKIQAKNKGEIDMYFVENNS